MHHFDYKGTSLFCEGVPLTRIADEVATPTYVYSAATLTRHFAALTDAFASVPHQICYSVKANSNGALLSLFAKLGAGFDVVSGGELHRVVKAGGDPRKAVFAGVGKTEAEMAYALEQGLQLFNVESEEELYALDRVGRQKGIRAPFALRVNPDVDAKTHRYIATGLKSSKFGVPFDEARALYEKSKKLRGLQARGLDCHIGSQLTSLSPVKAAVTKVAELYRALKAKGHALTLLDIGGGLGITYADEAPPSPAAYAQVVKRAIADTGATLLLEPGRVLVGNAGILLTRVLYRKKTRTKQFVVVDVGMNDLIRPALYEAHHALLPVKRAAGKAQTVDVVGPVCESSDVLARERKLIVPKAGALIAVMSAGAYGMSMASTYNSRPKPAEVLVEGKGFRVIRTRETYEELTRGEC